MLHCRHLALRRPSAGRPRLRQGGVKIAATSVALQCGRTQQQADGVSAQAEWWIIRACQGHWPFGRDPVPASSYDDGGPWAGTQVNQLAAAASGATKPTTGTAVVGWSSTSVDHRGQDRPVGPRALRRCRSQYRYPATDANLAAIELAIGKVDVAEQYATRVTGYQARAAQPTPADQLVELWAGQPGF